MIYQTDISYHGGAYEKTTNKKAIAYYVIAPVSCHAILFQPRFDHKRRIAWNHQRELYRFCLHVSIVYSVRKIILLLSLSRRGIAGMYFCSQ